MNEKKNYFTAIIAIILGFILAALFSGCATRPVVSTTDQSVVSSQISVAKLQTINEGLRDILQQYDGLLKEQNQRAVRGIDDALVALDRYDEFVQGLIRKIRELEHGTRTVED